MSDHKPLISIIISCFNYGRFIEETIETVTKQSYTNWEVIIIDDCSDDAETSIVLNRLKEKDTKISLINLTKRSGPSKARNLGIKKAKGEFILPLDSDDKIHPDYLSEAMNAFKSDSSLGVVYSEAEFFGNLHGKWNLPEYRFPEILLENSIFVSAFFRKSDWELVGGFNEAMNDEWEDYDFWLKLIEKGVKIHRIPKVLFFYRQGHASRSKRSGEALLPIYIQLFNNHRQLYIDNIQILFRRHLKAKEFEDQFSILTKNRILYGLTKAFISVLKAASFASRRIFR